MIFSALCPYCSGKLKKLPSRKTKCPSCGNFIYVKRKPSEEEKRLVTEAERDAIEALWIKRGEENDVLRSLSTYGINEVEYFNKKETFSNEENAPFKTFIFLLIKKIEASNDLGLNLQIHNKLAIELDKVDGDFIPHLKEKRRLELLEIQRIGLVSYVKIIVGQNCDKSCPCYLPQKEIMSLIDATRNMPLPHSNCSRVRLGNQAGYCDCWYSAVFDDELEKPKKKTINWNHC